MEPADRAAPVRLLAASLRALEALPPSARATIYASVALAIGSLDHATGPALSLSILYLLPVSAAAWVEGLRPSILVGLACSAIWLAVNHPRWAAAAAWLPLWNAAVRLGFFVIVATALAELRGAFRREQAMSRTDPLTGALNSRGFYEAAETELRRGHRYASPVSFALFDLDEFKQVNDQHGHAAGDEVLRTVAASVRDALRATDVLGRLGGDEFALLLPETEVEAAAAVADKVLQRVRSAMAEAGWPVGCSLGWASFERAPRLEEALAIVDRQMYRAKQAGKGRAVGGPAET